jgi:hypothetical protein
MTVAEKILQHLRAHRPEAFCDDCLAVAIGANRHQTQQATHPFGLTSEFDRREGQCAGCTRERLVIRAR